MPIDLSFLDTASLEPIKIPLTLGDKSYVLREASEDAYTAYRNVISKAVKYTEDGGHQDGGNEADALLIQRCLFEVVDTPTGKVEHPSKIDFVKGLPRRISGPLYKKVREISGMDEDIETVEFLTKRIAADTKKLETIKKGETETKNE